jgi:branched-subunit amino acid permease
LCRILSNELYAKVKTGSNLSSEFKVNTGFTQGDAIAPLLFSIVLKIAIRRSKVETQGTIFDKCSHLWHMPMMLEEDYKMLKKYLLHHWSNKYDGIRNI